MGISIKDARKLLRQKGSISHETLKSIEPPAEKSQKLFFRHSMYLLVKPSGSKLWQMRYKSPVTLGYREMSFGVFPEISRLEAESQLEKARALIRDGIDPMLHKQQLIIQDAEAHRHTFGVLAEEWFKVALHGKSASHIERNRRLLDELLCRLDLIPLREITSNVLYDAISPMINRKVLNSAHRARRMVNAIFMYGIDTEACTNNPAPYIKRRIPLAENSHFSAITDPVKLGHLLRDIDCYQGSITTKNALKFLAHTFVRPGEVSKLEWSWVNFEEQIIEFPASAMKKNREHIVPMSSQVIAILMGMQPITGQSKYVFTGQRGMSSKLSENTLNTALRRMDYDKSVHTAHGFRATARTILDERLGFSVHWIEHQLAHIQRDANGKAYNRSAYLDQRKNMMEKWSSYLEELKLPNANIGKLGGNVLPFSKAL